MADSAFQIQYRSEFIAQFEQGQSWLRNVCTTEAVIKGNQAMFLVAGSGGATAVTRGLNGNIPPRVDSLTQVPATLVEWHDKPQRTEFNIFASQGDGRRIMQASTVKVLNRKIDQDILGVLSGASSNLGSPQIMTLALASRAYVLETGRVVVSGPARALAADPRIRAAYLGLAELPPPARGAALPDKER